MLKKGLNATQLKIIAILAMLCDHIAWACVDFYSPAGQIMHIIGRLTIPIMCFFIAQGYQHTSNIGRYCERILFFAALSILPFYYFFSKEYGYRQNILFDLLCGLCALIITNKQKYTKLQKILLMTGLCIVSLVIGGWPIVLMLFILSFYYFRDSFKKQVIAITGITILLEIVLIAVNLFGADQFGIFFNENIWYEKLYLLGFVLALPLLKLYNGEKGETRWHPQLRYCFYVFYPLHLSVLGILFNPKHVSFQTVFMGIQVSAMILTIIMILIVAFSSATKSQMGNLVFMIFALVFQMGFLCEIQSPNIEALTVAIRIEYLAQSGFLLGFTCFAVSYGKIRMPKWVYVLEAVINCTFCGIVFLIDRNTWFYKSYTMDTSSGLTKVTVVPNVLYVIYYIYFAIIFLGAAVLFLIRLIKSSGLEKKRSAIALTGTLCPWVAMLLKVIGVSQGYDMIQFGIFAAMGCYFVAFIKYGYFNSIQVVNENALNHGKEGMLVIDTSHQVLFVNRVMKELFPRLQEEKDAYRIPVLKEIFEENSKILTLGEHIYDLRIEELIEYGYIQGYMLWVIEMTEHYRKMEVMRDKAETDGLTGLHNRMSFEANVEGYLDKKSKGAMYMLDMDNFKYVNDNYGHSTGDEVLRTFGEVLKEVMSEEECLCRIGGDEFAIFLKDVTEQRILEYKAQKIIALFQEKLKQNALPAITTVSIGIAITNGMEESFQILYGNADKALYFSKNRGKNQYHFFA